MKLRTLSIVIALACVTGSAIAQVETAQVESDQVEPLVAAFPVPGLLPGQYDVTYRLLRIGGRLPAGRKQNMYREQETQSQCHAPADVAASMLPLLQFGMSQCRHISGSVTGANAAGAVRCQDADRRGTMAYDGAYQPDSGRFIIDAEIHRKNEPGPMTTQVEMTLTRTSETCVDPEIAAAAAASESAEYARDAEKK